MRHCGQTATAHLLEKTLGSDIDCYRNLGECVVPGTARARALTGKDAGPYSTSKYDLSSWERRAIAERFWSKVRRGAQAECWEWTASTFINGLPYGQFVLPRDRDGRQPHVYAHRIAWVLTRGPIPDGLQVCHRCDNPKCCNPSHFFLGTQAENLADCRAKGRMPSLRKGKLSVADKVQIYARLAVRRPGDCAQIALEYGVSRPQDARMKRVFYALTLAVTLAGIAIVTQPKNGDLLCSLCAIYTPDDALYWIYGCFVCSPNGSETARVR